MIPEKKKKADAAAKLVADEKAKAEKVEAAEKAIPKGDYIMKVTHLAWGFKSKNHFYADKKPTINAKVMGSYASILKVWLEKNWIEKL